jgi:hypothetical protein
MNGNMPEAFMQIKTSTFMLSECSGFGVRLICKRINSQDSDLSYPYGYETLPGTTSVFDFQSRKAAFLLARYHE